MRFLRTNTAIRLTVGPFFDKTDGVTPEVAITVTSCKLTLMVDDANVPTLVLDTAPTASGGANDMVHVTGDDAGFYDLELAAANVNYLGRAMLAITDAATHCPVFHEFMILPAMIYDSMVLGTDRLDTNVTHVGDTSQTAGDIFARLGAPAGASMSADIAAVKTDTAAIKTKTDSLTFTVAGMADANVVDWKGATAPAMTGDAFARLGAPAGASVSADIAAAKVDTAAIKAKTDSLTFTVAGMADANVVDWKGATAPAMTGDAFARLGAPAGASVSADVAAVKADTAAVKAKTDSLTFTTAGIVDANVQQINDVTITGNGQVGTEFGV